MKIPASNVSLWVDTRSAPRFGALAGPLQTDVLVVGAGITGLTAALLLQQAGRQVTVVEARQVGQGVSGYTTAHVTEAVDARYHSIRADFGKDAARVVARSTRSAIELIRSLARTITPRCDFTPVPGFLYTESAEETDALNDEMEAAREAGLVVSMTRDVPLPFAVAAAVRFDDQARFHPRRYLVPLAEEIVRRGGRVFTDTRVQDFEAGTPCRVQTEKGEITAAHVLVATHSPINRLFLQTKVAPYRSYVLALRVDRPVGDALFWDDASPYHYVRQQRVGREDLLIVGGEDHKVGHETDTLSRYENLLDWARERFAVRSVEYRWSAQTTEPVDGLPYIGRTPQSDRVLVATGYSGDGMTFGTVAAILMRDLVLGKSNEWAEVYSAGRIKPLAAAKDFVEENADVAARFVLDRLRAPAGSALEPAPGEGRVVEVDGHKLAVFRPERGEAIGRVGRVHAPRLPGELERRRADLGLPLSRLALRDGRQRHRRAGHAGARASRARRRGAPRNGCRRRRRWHPPCIRIRCAMHSPQAAGARRDSRSTTHVSPRAATSSRVLAVNRKTGAGGPGGDSPAPAMSLSKDRGTLRSSSRVLAVNRETGAGGPGGDSPAPAMSLSKDRGTSRSSSRVLAANRETGAGGPGGDSPAPAMSLSRDRGTLRSSSRVLAANRKTGAGGPGGDSPAPAMSLSRDRGTWQARV